MRHDLLEELSRNLAINIKVFKNDDKVAYFQPRILIKPQVGV